MEETGYSHEFLSGNQSRRCKVEASQGLTPACQQNLILSPTESQFDVNSTPSSFQATSHLDSCGVWSCESNVVPNKNNFWVLSDQVQPENNVAMETATLYTPLQALRSLCNSISSTDVLNVPQASQGVLSSANCSECTQMSQFDLAPQLIDVVSSPFVPETQNVWRPWVYKRHGGLL